MEIRSLTGDDQINESLMAAMTATIDHLLTDGVITKDQRENFLDHHICMLAPNRGWLRVFLDRIFDDNKPDQARVIILEHRK